MFLSINGLQYHIEVRGEGPPLLLLHGFTGDGSTWECVLPFLKEFQTITVDLLGHGLTDSPDTPERYHIEQAANDLNQILYQLNYEEVYLLGYSMGGRLALGFTAAYPALVKALILESSSPGLKTEEERIQRISGDERLAERILSRGLNDFIGYWENIPLFSSQKSLPYDVQEEIRQNRLSQNPIGLANSLRGMGTGSQPSYWDELKSLSMDMLFIAGGLDTKFCMIAKEMEKGVKNAEAAIIDGAGHALHVEEPEKFGTIVSEFLKNT
ncbi:2-succinyl-6-hydroxy-2,4-cyclohexadiene-1-carboxylate synthase [Bacillus salacetis]|uniref:Putative 2-succinyl-6-hydroxy-2,4-cyclohexadiene-1-carboxylate synthase n=1 Tax=Bacillus salacetis TaxID=2315464 RepID=A0A3A1R164_9BACI|nr:2-succinyl-6-hydroxy-2,4-cyclohexadiene-1-carboxylate synthase [Bacillus salacetis]RIW35623.1 2-succinyl-6-hydroxy-2,4-cyclohexadiene-1-carboxylate synthase [Bacillus salacetis]